MGNDFKGMTVNERLVVSGLLGDFDKAVWNKDAEKVAEILKTVELDYQSINAILDHFELKTSTK